QVKDLALNQTNNTLLAGTYGRSMYQLFLDDARPNYGALRAISGTSSWGGTVQLIGDATHPVIISANGTQALQNGIATASLNILGPITDRVPNLGNDSRVIKEGKGDITFSGVNLYGGVTEVKEGVLIVGKAQALGASSGGVSTITITNGGSGYDPLNLPNV